MNYIIRLANNEDCEELSKLKLTIWKTTYKGIYPDTKINTYNYIENTSKFRSIIDDSEEELYVVDYNSKLIGYMNYGIPYRKFKNYKQEIGLLYILKEYQRMGIGKELFNIAYNNIKEKGYEEFFISCNKYNLNAQKFYEKMGGIIIHIDEDNIDKSIPQIKYLYKIKSRRNI